MIHHARERVYSRRAKTGLRARRPLRRSAFRTGRAGKRTSTGQGGSGGDTRRGMEWMMDAETQGLWGAEEGGRGGVEVSNRSPWGGGVEPFSIDFQNLHKSNIKSKK